MIIIPDKLRRPAEVERDELRKHLAEAQAEIENLKWHINSEKAKAEAALALNDRALGLVNEARADAEHWKSECNALQRMVHEARAEIDGLTLMTTNASMEPARRLIQKNKELHAVIEQMREALKLVDSVAFALPKWFDGDDISVWNTVKAALAVERGE